MTDPTSLNLNHVPNYNSHILDNCENIHIELTSDTYDLLNTLRVAQALLFLIQWRGVLRELAEKVGRTPELPEIPNEDMQLVKKWIQSVEEDMLETCTEIEENNRLWESELILAFGI